MGPLTEKGILIGFSYMYLTIIFAEGEVNIVE